LYTSTSGIIKFTIALPTAYWNLKSEHRRRYCFIKLSNERQIGWNKS